MNWKNKRVLVTGGTGFIGSFLVERLLDAGAQVRVPIRAANYRALSERRDEVEWMEGDLRSNEYCQALVAHVDHVFHLASHRRNVAYHQKYCGDVMAENVLMTAALIGALKEWKETPVTFLSTANVPPSSDVLSLAQGEKIDGYVLGKALSETLWFAAARQRKFKLLIARPVGVYGPRDTFSEEGNVIPSLMVKARDNETVLKVWGSGQQERAFLYVEDLVKAIFTMIDAGAEGMQYVVPPHTLTIRDLAFKVRDLVHPGLNVEFDTSKPEGSRSLAKLPNHASLENFEWTTFDEGLQKTFDWWQHKKEE